jgi:hypothetical protein
MSGALRPAMVGAAVGVLSLALFLALNYLSLGRGGQQRIAEARASGVLTDDDYLRGNTVLGFHQANDCLILRMAVDQRAPKERLAVSPLAPTEMYHLCHRLGGPAGSANFYHNYIHGHTMLARYLLPALSVEKIRELYRLSISFVLFVGIAFALLRLAQGNRGSVVFLIALMGFARFFGLETFGQSLSHGPSDLVLIGYVVWLAVKPRRSLVLGGAVFGALTMIFEFMTGGLPMGLAVVMGLSWFALDEPSVEGVLYSSIAYLTAAASAIAAKWLAVVAVFGPAALLSVGPALSSRMTGGVQVQTLYPNMTSAMLNSMDALIPGMGVLALLLTVTAIAAGAYALWRGDSAAIRLLALSVLPIVGWFAVFHQHTIIHAWFMDRMLVWIIVAGFGAYATALPLADNSKRRTALSAGSLNRAGQGAASAAAATTGRAVAAEAAD